MNPEWLGAYPVYCLAVWVLLSGLDDLLPQLVFFYLLLSGDRGPRPPCGTGTRQKPIAIFVPLWHEHAVIGHMLEHNLAAIRYAGHHFFVGVYPNDSRTAAAVLEVEQRFPNVHMAMGPHDGPTSKADCLNWIYQRMLLWEEEQGAHFEAVVTHDAEDLIHPESLAAINRYLDAYDMVQVPVLPLPTPPGEWTHGLYCDEFAEFQIKDIPVRQFLGGFIASNGVGTGFSRKALEALADRHANRIFEPVCLTEDYEAGFRIHALGRPQVFIPLRHSGPSLVATREFFPRSFRAAVKQRTRWVTGIALQGWERHGWRVPLKQSYWLWRDRKGLVGNLLTPVLNLMFLWGLACWAGAAAGRPWVVRIWEMPGLAPLCGFTLALSILQLGVRAACVRRIYGGAFAVLMPLRAVFGNFLNCISTVLALWRYFAARLQGRPLVWLKTDHCYPGRAALMAHKRPLGEILAELGLVTRADLRDVDFRPAGERIGEYLIRAGRLTEERLYTALSVQQSLPLGKPARVTRPAASSLPAAVARKWNVLPYQVRAGKLFVAGPELPSDEMHEDLQRHSNLEVRFQLVTPRDFRELAEQYPQ